MTLEAEDDFSSTFETALTQSLAAEQALKTLSLETGSARLSTPVTIAERVLAPGGGAGRAAGREHGHTAVSGSVDNSAMNDPAAPFADLRRVSAPRARHHGRSELPPAY